jgi:hypothetical protein
VPERCSCHRITNYQFGLQRAGLFQRLKQIFIHTRLPSSVNATVGDHLNVPPCESPDCLPRGKSFRAGGLVMKFFPPGRTSKGGEQGFGKRKSV